MAKGKHAMCQIAQPSGIIKLLVLGGLRAGGDL
jgi:hypothetical protein